MGVWCEVWGRGSVGARCGGVERRKGRKRSELQMGLFAVCVCVSGPHQQRLAGTDEGAEVHGR